nr:hypothetical protein [Treponema denticola]
MKKYFVIILIFHFLVKLSSQELLPNTKYYSDDGSSYFKFTEQGGVSKGFIWNKKTQNELMIFSLQLRYKLRKDAVRWFNNKIFEIKIHTGNPGVYSIFVSVNDGIISNQVNFVMAVDITGSYALVGEEDVYVLDIFKGKKIFYINRNYDNTAIKYLIFDLKETKFLDNGDLVIAYYNLSMEKVYEFLNKNDFMRF